MLLSTGVIQQMPQVYVIIQYNTGMLDNMYIPGLPTACQLPKVAVLEPLPFQIVVESHIFFHASFIKRVYKLFNWEKVLH